jgi:Holliday junction resolvase RusA-like endonuclease
VTANLVTTLEQCSIQSYSFFVAGKPETQGSKSAFGRAYTDKEGRQRVAVAMVEQSKGLYAWRASIGRVATLMRPKDWETDGIYLLSALFCMKRPQNHFNSKGFLKEGAPVLHSVKGDADKLLRACGDALTKICYNDDALIVAASSLKVFCDPKDGPGVHIKISRLDPVAASAMVLALKP